VEAGEATVLLLAGFGGGLSGSVAGLASLVSYPALLAVGLPPVTANVTNTVALVCSSTGSVWGSLPELRGQRARVRQLAIAGMIGGALGALLLLVTPADAFEKAVPVLIAVAALAILARRRLIHEHVQPDHPVGRRTVAGIGVVGIYGGYFGAGAGVMLLALLLLSTGDTVPRANAVKNVILGLANGVAALGFVVFGPVRWSVVPPLGVGLLLGGRLGPSIVRRVPGGALRIAIALAGLGLAAKLAYDAYS
jgi:uncharacterized membrane protein YfcA